MIPYGRQDITQEDIEQVIEVLKSDFLTQGPQVPAFEKAIASCVKANYAVAVNSATSALHIACLALGVKSGDVVWTTPITFVASANCALYCGAKVDFVDIDPQTYNISVSALEIKLQEAKRSGILPKVLIPVHLCGQSCDMEKIHDLSSEYGFSIIEDASHAIGGEYKTQPVGNCQYSDITVFSFHPVKIITTAEGGVAVTNNFYLAEKMQLLRSHGITRDVRKMTHEPDGPWYYQQIELGFNYRMTDIQAALGVSQLQRLKEYVDRRNQIVQCYDAAFKGLPLILPWQHPNARSAWHLYVIRLRTNLISKTHAEVFEALRAMGIGVNLHYIPVHLQPWYSALGFRPGQYPEAEKYYSEAISLPVFSTMNEAQIASVISAVSSVLEGD